MHNKGRKGDAAVQGNKSMQLRIKTLRNATWTFVWQWVNNTGSRPRVIALATLLSPLTLK